MSENKINGRNQFVFTYVNDASKCFQFISFQAMKADRRWYAVKKLEDYRAKQATIYSRQLSAIMCDIGKHRK